MMDKLQMRFENVMIIDDNLIDLYIVARLISKTDFGKKVLQYPSAIEALNYLQENQDNISLLPEVIFLDIYMPGMTGFEFMEHFDKLPVTLKKHCNVFIISSTIDEKDVAKAKNDINVVDIREKPISKDFLNGLKISLSGGFFNYLSSSSDI